MSGTEIGLLMALAALISAVIGVAFGGLGKVPKSSCTLKHEGLADLLEAEFKGVNARLARIEKSLGSHVFIDSEG